jgi:hypothetical protein
MEIDTDMFGMDVRDSLEDYSVTQLSLVSVSVPENVGPMPTLSEVVRYPMRLSFISDARRRAPQGSPQPTRGDHPTNQSKELKQR